LTGKLKKRKEWIAKRSEAKEREDIQKERTSFTLKWCNIIAVPPKMLYTRKHPLGI
jgi:hypothetical protein